MCRSDDARLWTEVGNLHFRSSHLSKSGATAEKYISDLRELRHLLADSPGLDFQVVDMPLDPTPAFDATRQLDRASATSTVVREALYQRPLFTFGEPTVTRI